MMMNAYGKRRRRLYSTQSKIKAAGKAQALYNST